MGPERGLAVVVDEDGRVAGTVTDGALRRAAIALALARRGRRGALSCPDRVAECRQQGGLALLAAHRLPPSPWSTTAVWWACAADEFDGHEATPVAMVWWAARASACRYRQAAEALATIGRTTIVERLIEVPAGVVDV